MVKAKKHSVAARILLTISIVIIIILSVLWLGQTLIESKITALLEKEPIGLNGKSYVTKIGKVRVDLTRRSISVSDVMLRTTTSRNTQDGPAVMLDISIPKITASGIRYRKRNDNEKASIYLRALAITSPSITYEGTPKPDKHTATKGERESGIPGVIIKKLVITNGNARISSWKEGKKTVYSTAGLNMEITGLTLGKPDIKIMPVFATKKIKTAAKNAVVSSSAGSFSKRIFSEIKFNADAISYTLKNGALTFAADTLSADSETGKINVKRLAITPQYNKHQFNDKVGDHSDWLNIVVEDIALSGLTIPFSGDDNSVMKAETLSVSRATIESYKNRNQIQSDKIKPMLYQSIQNIPIGIDISSVDISDLNVHYEEVSPGEKEVGRIDITDINATITGLTNRPTQYNQHYDINASGMLLGTGRMDMVMTFPADSLNDHFAVRAKLGTMPATTFSSITEPLAGIRITSGEVNGANITIEGNSYESYSNVELLYSDLKVAMVNRKKQNRQKELLTFIANDFLIKRSNPEKGKLRMGEGEFERDRQKSFWNYLWKSSFVGVKKIVI